ncbi:MAG: cation:dicarboxylase symporter family transporter, partial [bacterium]|nr:cation:dicarboxylase symporter family transporter [bacterium]
MLTELYDRWTQISLIKRIIGGLVVGIIAAFVAPVNLHFITIFGDLFVNSLKAVAPLLVFFLVMSSLSKQEQSQPTNIRIILVLYIVGTLAAAVTSVVISYFYNVKLVLAESAQGLNPPGGIADVISNIALKVVGNPIQSICEANYIGILFWAVVFGVALRHASESTHSFLTDFSNAISAAVRFVIQFAPLGVMGLVFSSIVNTGAESLLVYAQVA